MQRRHLLATAGKLSFAWGLWATQAYAQEVVKEVHALEPGEFTWQPELSPSGPLAVVVSLPDQLVHVYRNGIRIAVSTCSTGKPGHETPTGVFTVLQKDKDHHSRTYNNAPMPNMNRLTWDGIALHAGKLPGYPASHGCVRLPLDFSAKLFEITQIGMPVIIAGTHADPAEIVHPGLLLSDAAEHELEAAVAGLGESAPPAWHGHPGAAAPATSALVSSADRRLYLIEDGEIAAEGVVSIADPSVPLGSHVFVLSGASDRGAALVWHGVGFRHDDAAAGRAEAAALSRIRGDTHLIDALHASMRPGMVFVTTDLPAHADTRSGRDFVIMTPGTDLS